MNNDQWSGFVILYFKRVPTVKECGQKEMDTFIYRDKMRTTHKISYWVREKFS